MFVAKKSIAFAFLALTPVVGLGAMQWTEVQDRKPQDWIELRDRAETLETELQDARRQVGETLDMLEDSVKRQLSRHRNCAPSKNSLVYYQWLDANQHKERAERFLDECVKVLGRGHSRRRNMLRYAWSLMTERKTAGQFDRVALALAERAVAANADGVSGDALDTLALAKFLDGQVERAVELERQALASQEGNDDFRRRLRMYEAARDAASLRVASTDTKAPAADLADALAHEGSREADAEPGNPFSESGEPRD